MAIRLWQHLAHLVGLSFQTVLLKLAGGLIPENYLARP
jgi:hypothetical protein